MSLIDGKTEFELSRPVTYSHKGETIQGHVLALYEPAMEHSKGYRRISQMLTRCAMEMAILRDKLGAGEKQTEAGGRVLPALHEAEAEHEAQAVIDEELIRVTLEAAERSDEFVEVFGDMVCAQSRKPLCMVDGQERMTRAIWDRLHPEDAFNTAIRWASFFATPSLSQRNASGRRPESPTQPVGA